MNKTLEIDIVEADLIYRALEYYQGRQDPIEKTEMADLFAKLEKLKQEWD